MKLVKRDGGSGHPKPFGFPSVDHFFRDPFFRDESIFPSIFNREKHALSDFSMPSADISETKKAITIEVDVPGYDPDDIAVEIDENMVSVEGKMEKEEEKKEKKYYRKERSSGSFYREFSLPPYANVSKAKSAIKSGTLKITIPKKSESKKVKVKVESK